MTRRAIRAAALVLVAGLATVLWPAAPAAAHPFGDPQTVQVSGGGTHLQVVWRVGMSDDLTLLAIELGVLPEDRVLLDGAITYEDDDAELVAESPELRDYLLERITVEADGSACPGEVTRVGDLMTDGALLEFACDASVETSALTVRTLTDLHPAYRTLASGPDGQRAVYGSSVETHEWTLPSEGVEATGPDEPTGRGPADADLGRSAALQLGSVAGVLLVLILVGVLGLRRYRTNPTRNPEKESSRDLTT